MNSSIFETYFPTDPAKAACSKDITQSVSALLDFHRRTFGGWTMEDGDQGGSQGGSQGDRGGTDSGQGGSQGAQSGTDTAQTGTQGQQQGQQDQTQDLGFPADTPLIEMTPAQQAAYYKHQNRRAEQRASAYHQAVGGKTPEQVAADLAELDRVKRDQMTEQQRAVEDAKREAAEETRRDLGLKSARTVMDLALSHVEATERSELLDTLDLTKVLTDSGEVDTDKVRRLAERIAPAGKAGGSGSRLDFGGGRERGHSRPTSGVAAGAARYAERKGKPASSAT